MGGRRKPPMLQRLIG